jgi:hypothetical protein
MIATAITARRRSLDQELNNFEERSPTEAAVVRALGAGWLEWRWIEKPSGRKFGPYVYYR